MAKFMKALSVTARPIAPRSRPNVSAPRIGINWNRVAVRVKKTTQERMQTAVKGAVIKPRLLTDDGSGLRASDLLSVSSKENTAAAEASKATPA